MWVSKKSFEALVARVEVLEIPRVPNSRTSVEALKILYATAPVVQANGVRGSFSLEVLFELIFEKLGARPKFEPARTVLAEENYDVEN